MNAAQRFAFLILGASFLLFLLINHLFSPHDGPIYHAGILISAPHQALNFTLEGVKKKLFTKLNQQIKFTELYGNGTHEHLQNCAKTLTLNENHHLFIAIGSPACHVLKNIEKKRPIVFAAVSDPKLHELNQDNLCGISDKVEHSHLFKFIKELVPSAKKIGILYTPDEPHIINDKKNIEEISRKEHLEPIEINLREKDNQTKYKEADILLAMNNNTLASSMKTIAQHALELKKPLFTSYTPAVREGAFAARGIDYHKCGRKAGKFAFKLLSNKAQIQELGVVYMPDNDIMINQHVSEQLNIKIPQKFGHFVQTLD